MNDDWEECGRQKSWTVTITSDLEELQKKSIYNSGRHAAVRNTRTYQVLGEHSGYYSYINSVFWMILKWN